MSHLPCPYGHTPSRRREEASPPDQIMLVPSKPVIERYGDLLEQIDSRLRSRGSTVMTAGTNGSRNSEMVRICDLILFIVRYDSVIGDKLFIGKGINAINEEASREGSQSLLLILGPQTGAYSLYEMPGHEDWTSTTQTSWSSMAWVSISELDGNVPKDYHGVNFDFLGRRAVASPQNTKKVPTGKREPVKLTLGAASSYLKMTHGIRTVNL